MTLRIGLVVGEKSGEKLAIGLIQELKRREIPVEISGVVSDKLVALGCEKLFSTERLSVMGFIEPFKRIIELIKMRKWLINYFTTDPVDLFIGIDAPEFNLGLEKRLSAAGITTVHYVSPSVWAWRPKRIKLIKKACDLMLTLFPFEADFYKKHNVPVEFVGHPTADKINQIDRDESLARFGLDVNKKTVLLMPGSRSGELKHMARLYLEVAYRCYRQDMRLQFLLPVVSEEHKLVVSKLIEKLGFNLPVVVAIDKSWDMMAACDIALVTSGTATLEVMLHHKPMLIAYKTNWLTYNIARFLIQVPYIGLPNLLAGKSIVSEYIQKDANVSTLSASLLSLIYDKERQESQVRAFKKISANLRKKADKKTVDSIINVLGVDECSLRA